METLREKMTKGLTLLEKTCAKYAAEKLVLDLIDANISFRLSTGLMGCYTIMIPDNCGDHARFYFADKARLYNGRHLWYEESWISHDHNKMLDVFMEF